MHRRFITFSLGLLLPLLLLAVACGTTTTVTVEETPSTPTTEPTTPPATTAPSTGAVDFSALATAPAYTWEPAQFDLEAGRSYVFQVTGQAEFHTFTIRKDKDSPTIVNENIDANTTVTVTVPALQPGTYQLVCIVHESFGQMGTIAVK